MTCYIRFPPWKQFLQENLVSTLSKRIASAILWGISAALMFTCWCKTAQKCLHFVLSLWYRGSAAFLTHRSHAHGELSPEPPAGPSGGNRFNSSDFPWFLCFLWKFWLVKSGRSWFSCLMRPISPPVGVGLQGMSFEWFEFLSNIFSREEMNQDLGIWLQGMSFAWFEFLGNIFHCEEMNQDLGIWIDRMPFVWFEFLNNIFSNKDELA